MKTTVQTLHHIQGEYAYRIYWQHHYNCQPRLESIKAIDLNLEIIVDNECKLLAYRYDYSDDMKWMVINAGQWKVDKEVCQNSESFDKVRILIVSLRNEICPN